ncbi:hypothetical protein HY772_09715 [Candidatus Woesearchaeota archaeon]|nr:hypothetical protein [Candidatus Woesearchaeota archaeon]
MGREKIIRTMLNYLSNMPLANILRNQTAKEKPTSPITGLWTLHPTAKDRLNALENPHTLFRLTLDLPFTVGVLIAFIIGGVFYISIPLILILISAPIASILYIDSNITNANQIEAFELLILSMVAPVVTLGYILAITVIILPIFGITYLAAWTVGLQVQREAVAEAVLKPQGCIRGCAKYLSLWGVAALIALGMEAGFLITPINLFSPQTLTAALLIIPWLIAATGLTWLWLVCARYFGEKIFNKHIGLTPPKLKRRVLNVALSILFCALYLPLLASRFLIIYNNYMISKDFATMGSIALVTLIVALALYVILFGAMWVFIQLGSFLFPPHCPSCKQIVRQKEILGKSCEHCGHELAAWLFVERPTK